MADLNQFGSAKPPQSADAQHCAQCEAMLTDALDGTLSAADQAAFDLHLIGCPSCTTMLADAQRGAAWLEMLKSPRPSLRPPCSNRILAQTSGQTSTEAKPTIVLGPTDYSVSPTLCSANRRYPRLRPRIPQQLHPAPLRTFCPSAAASLPPSGSRTSATR